MSIDQDKAFEVQDGIILSEGGAALFSGSGSPQGNDAPVGSWYFETSGPDLWHKELVGPNGWVQHEDANKPRGKDHNNIVTTDTPVISGSYMVVGLGPAGGEDTYPPNTTFKFIVEAYKNGGGDMDVRLYNETDAVELATLNFTGTTPEVKSTTFTFTGGEKSVSIQAQRSGSQGNIAAADVVMEW